MGLTANTWHANAETAERAWWVVDCADKRVGRIATSIANLLRGKHKAGFTPHVDNGDFVVAINVDKLQFTGKKLDQKKYYRHSRYFGSLKEKTAAQLQEEDPTFILHEAVRGMLPTSKQSRHILQKLKIFTGGEHTHSAQKPQPYKIN